MSERIKPTISESAWQNAFYYRGIIDVSNQRRKWQDAENHRG